MIQSILVPSSMFGEMGLDLQKQPSIEVIDGFLEDIAWPKDPKTEAHILPTSNEAWMLLYLAVKIYAEVHAIENNEHPVIDSCETLDELLQSLQEGVGMKTSEAIETAKKMLRLDDIPPTERIQYTMRLLALVDLSVRKLH